MNGQSTQPTTHRYMKKATATTMYVPKHLQQLGHQDKVVLTGKPPLMEPQQPAKAQNGIGHHDGS